MEIVIRVTRWLASLGVQPLFFFFSVRIVFAQPATERTYAFRFNQGLVGLWQRVLRGCPSGLITDHKSRGLSAKSGRDRTGEAVLLFEDYWE